MAIEWIMAEFGESERANVGTGLRLLVQRDGFGTRGGLPPKWMAHIFDAALKKRFDTKAEAKAAAERAARSWLAKAVENLASAETSPA